MSKREANYMQSADGNVFTTSFPEYHKECRHLGRAEGERLYRAQTIASLKKMIKPGQTVYCNLNSVSSSGMSRRISLYAVHKNELVNITYSAAVAMGRTISDKGGIQIGGCGMDMGFALVYDLGASLWPKGTPKPHSTRNGEPDKAGGYALKHSWL